MKTNLRIVLVLVSFALIQIVACKKESKINTLPDYGTSILGTWSFLSEKDETYNYGTLTKTTIDTVSNYKWTFKTDTVEHLLVDANNEALFKAGYSIYHGEEPVPFEYYIQSNSIIFYDKGEGGGASSRGIIKSITASSMEIDIQSEQNEDGNKYLNYLYFSR